MLPIWRMCVFTLMAESNDLYSRRSGLDESAILEKWKKGAREK